MGWGDRFLVPKWDEEPVPSSHHPHPKKGGVIVAKKKRAEDWAEAKKRCRLNEADIKMAKELGMTPKSLLKNIPASNEKWKAPVKVWIRDLYENKFGRVLKNENSGKNDGIKGKSKKQDNHYISESWEDEDLPF